MSYDLMVWHAAKALTSEAVEDFFDAITHDDHSLVVPHENIAAFIAELTRKHPQPDDLPVEKLDRSPWTCGFDQSGGHVILSLSWSRVESTAKLVKRLAKKHQLACYDPQAREVFLPSHLVPKPPARPLPKVRLEPAANSFSLQIHGQEPLLAITDERLLKELNRQDKRGEYVMNTLVAPNGAYVEMAGRKVTCLLERWDPATQIRLRAVQGQPNVPWEDGTLLSCWKDGGVPLKRDEWLRMAQVIEVFRCFLRGQPFPADLSWRDVSQRPNIRANRVDDPVRSKIFDEVEHHYQQAYPSDLSPKQAYVHTGMFIGWLIEHGLLNAEFLERAAGFRERRVSCAEVFERLGGKLTTDMLNPDGLRFAAYYYTGKQWSLFFEDYRELLARGLPSPYCVADTWENFERLRKLMDERYESWLKRQPWANSPALRQS